MDIIRGYSRRSFVWIIFFMALLLILVDSVFYFGLKFISTKIAVLVSANPDTPLSEFEGLLKQFDILQDNLQFYLVPVSGIVFILFVFFLWLFLRLSFVRLVKKSDYGLRKKPVSITPEPKISKKQKERHDRRFYLHLVSILQNEGRLVDFLSEDLRLYEDAQIGAAVRNIHENCKKTINKYLAPKAVIDKSEGDPVTVQEGFDPSRIKLTGNVTGEPPFEGLLRHRGWKATKLDLPKLSGREDAMIIAPAEIEIM
ncbi:MAG: DUF2760 domain-containing protein [Deltaproteobacteria bacterium]|nr:DUF2760 domain-containing protein [Deltaproteobacteria bacterium]